VGISGGASTRGTEAPLTLEAMFGLQPQFTVGRGGGTGACKQDSYKLNLH
jgi:hypothetical protein